MIFAVFGIPSQCFQTFCPKMSKIGHNLSKKDQNWSKNGQNHQSFVLKLKKGPNQSIISANSDNIWQLGCQAKPLFAGLGKILSI